MHSNICVIVLSDMKIRLTLVVLLITYFGGLYYGPFVFQVHKTRAAQNSV